MKLKFLAILLIVMTLSGCEDEQPKYEARFLLPGQWQLTDWYDDNEKDINNDGQASVNLYSQWEGCSKNVRINFKAGNTFETSNYGNPDNPGCTSINVSEGAITRWELLNEDTVLLTGNNFTREYKIVTLEDELLVLEGADLLVNANDIPSGYNGGYLRFARYSEEGNK